MRFPIKINGAVNLRCSRFRSHLRLTGSAHARVKDWARAHARAKEEGVGMREINVEEVFLDVLKDGDESGNRYRI